MNNHEEQRSISDRDVEDQQQPTDDSSSVSRGAGEGSSAAVSGGSLRRREGNGMGLAARLTDLFVGDGDGDGDLLLQRGTQEGTVVQWLQALDMQVMGACRADERLKPLLKLNVSSVAEDRLLSHLSQHFEPSEVGLLARCLCIPLVSIRVGKINKQGTLLVPTSSRGNLTLSLLPTSDMRVSFLGDDGHAERLSTLRTVTDCSGVVIEGIPTDNSGRSFSVHAPRSEPFYFWCSEKSRLLGNELLEKMKNLLGQKPSLAELTGISDSRLQRFVAHLRMYFVGNNSNTSTTVVSRTPPTTTSLGPTQVCRSLDSPSLVSNPSRARSLSPSPSSFEDVSFGLPTSEQFSALSPGLLEKGKLPESLSIGTSSSPSAIRLEPNSSKKAVETSFVTSPSSLFSPPYYCWCPPVASTFQYTVASTAESFTLPPLSSLLATTAPLLTPQPTLNHAEIPPFLPEPLVRFPLSMPHSQPIPTFNPLMCDSIVHIPVMDICSSGQAYLVSGGPAMSASIPPTDSVAETSARNTLRLLISGSSQLPLVLANTDGGGGSRGLYGGATDVNNAIANSIAAVSLVSLSERSGVVRRCIGQDDLVHLLEEPVGSGGTCSDSLSDHGDGEGAGRNE